MAGTGRLSADQQAVLDAVVARVPRGRVVVALSGGGDSAALAWAVCEAGLPAIAVTVDHGLDVSPPLVAAATQIAARLGMEHRVVRVLPSSPAEADLRAARLAALERAEPGVTILTGHTADDQAETVLGNLLRGAGPTGLAGIPERRGRWLRPLLGISRETARAAATAAGLPFSDDPSNRDTAIRRNRLRHETLPALEASYNPALRATLARTARLVAADDALIERRAAGVPVRPVGDSILIPAAALETLPPPVAARVVRRALRMAHDPYPGDADDVAAVIAAVSGTTGQLGGALLAEREGPWVAIHPAVEPEPPAAVPLPVPGAVSFGRWRIASGAPAPGLGRLGATVSGDHLVVRAAAAGDRIAFAGGAKKVFDALAEAGVPRRRRPQWPVVESDGMIVWLVGVRAAPARGSGRVALSAHEERM
jgi:tRNA(Ile)-lysidine synthase